MADSWQTIEQAAVSLRLSVRTVNRHIVAGKLPSRLTPEGRREVLVSLPDTPADTPPVRPPAIARPASPLSEMPGGAQHQPSQAGAGAAGPSPFDASVSAAAEAVTGTWNGGFDPAAPAQAAPEEASPASSASAASGSPFSQAASPPVTVDPETVLALADNAAQKAEMAVTAYQTLARVADTQVRQVRRQARAAWAAVAAMAVGVTGAVGWTTHRLTRATGEVEHLQQEVFAQRETTRALSDKQDKLLADRAAAEQALRAEFTARHDAAVAERVEVERAAREALSAAREEAARAEGQLAAYREQEAARQTRETVAAAAAMTATPPVLSVGSSISDPFDTTSGIDSPGKSAPAASDAARPASDSARPTATTRPSAAPEKRAPAPAARQNAPRRKAAPPTTRPAVEVSDAPGASDDVSAR